jgi:hypothetical protein
MESPILPTPRGSTNKALQKQVLGAYVATLCHMTVIGQSVSVVESLMTQNPFNSLLEVTFRPLYGSRSFSQNQV